MGVAPGLGLIKKMLDFYGIQHFKNEQNTRKQITVVYIATKILEENGLKQTPGIQEVQGVLIYPSEYFCPINVTTGKLHITKNTRSIHHYAASWVSSSFSLKVKIKRFLPERLLIWISAIKRKIRK